MSIKIKWKSIDARIFRNLYLLEDEEFNIPNSLTNVMNVALSNGLVKSLLIVSNYEHNKTK